MIHLQHNQSNISLSADPQGDLLHFLREKCADASVRFGCGSGHCGLPRVRGAVRCPPQPGRRCVEARRVCAVKDEQAAERWAVRHIADKPAV